MNDDVELYQIDDATLEDIESVVQIEKQTNPYNPWSAKTFIQSIQDERYYFWVLKHQNKICGFCVVSVVGSTGINHILGGFHESEGSGVSYNKEGQLQSIAIDSSEHGKGLGRLLLDYVIDICRVVGVKQLFLEVRESNFVAQKLYETSGFEFLVMRKKYYPRLENGVKSYEDAKAYRLTL